MHIGDEIDISPGANDPTGAEYRLLTLPFTGSVAARFHSSSRGIM
jgi:hypothetical protein